MKSIWDTRYSEEEYAYGILPNKFLSAQLKNLNPGKILLPCEGEGRNGVYAAVEGWIVDAFDLSTVGKKKAELLADKYKVQMNYQLADASKVDYPAASFDVIALIYAHFPPEIRKLVHRNMIRWLKPGGKLILEAFNTGQLQNNSGGPKDPDMLYTEKMLTEDFYGMKIEKIESTRIILDEGKYHQGPADVIRFIGVK